MLAPFIATLTDDLSELGYVDQRLSREPTAHVRSRARLGLALFVCGKHDPIQSPRKMN